jgi:hypothetical protein
MTPPISGGRVVVTREENSIHMKRYIGLTVLATGLALASTAEEVR